MIWSRSRKRLVGRGILTVGDVDGDGAVTSADGAIILSSQLAASTPVMSRPDLCEVGGSAGCS